MSYRFRSLLSAVLTAGWLVSIWYLISNIQSIQTATSALLLTAAGGILVAFSLSDVGLIAKLNHSLRSVSQRKNFNTIVLLVIMLLGLLARGYFYYRFSYAPVSDPVTFYDSAKMLSTDGNLTGSGFYSRYVAFQPYLSAYNNILGQAMKIIPSPWLATIALNTIFDIFASLSVYVLLKRLLKSNSWLPTVGFGVWLLNPLNIIFSVISLPIIIVNFFVILMIVVSHSLMEHALSLQTKNALLVSVLLGTTIGVGNTFRPIFSLAIVALALIFTLMILAHSERAKLFRLSFSCLLIVGVLFTGVQRLNLGLVAEQTGLEPANNPSGWSMYVGSSFESFGQWRPHHNNEMAELCKESHSQGNFNECHAQLRSKAISRYTQHGGLPLASLFVEKLHHQAGKQNYFYNAEHSIVGYSGSKAHKAIDLSMILFMAGLFSLSARSFYSFAKQAASKTPINPLIPFMAILLVGWFLAFMLMESAPRYSTVIYPFFIVFAVLGLRKNIAIKSQPDSLPG